MQKQRVQKLITFSPQLYELVEGKAQRLGVTFPEYIRSLALEDIKDNKAPYITVSPELEEEIELSLADFKKGDYKEFDPENEDDMNELFNGK